MLYKSAVGVLCLRRRLDEPRAGISGKASGARLEATSRPGAGYLSREPRRGEADGRPRQISGRRSGGDQRVRGGQGEAKEILIQATRRAL